MQGQETPGFLVSPEETKDVINMRKLELMIDVLTALESANSADLYGIKLNVIDKIDRLVNKL
tara:strand:- start:4536 stop:4721 length:186 start_codon:yes stop_codon:yes gene_type:complete